MEVKRWTKSKLLGFGLITTLLVLLLLECVFRIIFHYEYKGYQTSVYVQGSPTQMSDATLIWRNRPYYLDVCKRFQFNEEGMKSLPADVTMPAKKDNDYWVFLFGGSTMEGVGSNPNGEWLDITGVSDHAVETTIGGYLQQYLQNRLPSKNVRVFNAAASGYTLFQSMLRYEELSHRHDIDWVISLDGNNEPPALLPGQSVRDYLQKDWDTNAVFRFPRNIAIPVTAHSAFAGKMKQMLFLSRYRGRMQTNKENGFPKRAYWLKSAAQAPVFAPITNGVRLAVDSFHWQLMQFDSILTAKHQQHLLLVQPHLALRDTSILQPVEKALYSYYASLSGRSLQNCWLKNMYDSIEKRTVGRSNVQLLTEMHHLPFPVFVDYCHLTKEANRYVARRIADHILKNIR